MPDISPVGPNSAGPLERTGSSTFRREAQPPAPLATPPERPGDRVELSDHARYLDQLRRLPEVREDRVAAVKEEIATGAYETESRLEAALEGLLDDLTG